MISLIIRSSITEVLIILIIILIDKLVQTQKWMANSRKCDKVYSQNLLYIRISIVQCLEKYNRLISKLDSQRENLFFTDSTLKNFFMFFSP